VPQPFTHSVNEVDFTDPNVSGANMVAELVLTSETYEEAIQVDLTRAKSTSVIGRPKASNRNDQLFLSRSRIALVGSAGVQAFPKWLRPHHAKPRREEK